MITVVRISKQALKDLKRTPLYIQEKFRAWLVAVSKTGLIETRKRPGWHDEPLYGNRKNNGPFGLTNNGERYTLSKMII